MLKLKCNCGKVLAAGETRCSLCVLGFAPARPVDVAADYQTSVRVTAREASGISCPRCMARLSVAEVAHSTCSHCHAVIAKDAVAAPAYNRSPRFVLKNSSERRAVVHMWPEQASTK